MQQGEEKDIKISSLQAKVKYLQRQISQRVRSFLLRNPGKKLAPSTKTKGIQVQFNEEVQQISSKYISGDSSLSNSGVRQYKKEENSTRHELTSAEQSELSDCVSNVWLAEVVGKILDPQLTERQSSIKRQTSSVQSGTDIWKLKKKYAKLEQKLKFQTEIATCAKEQLLRSEQENYNFRLKIKQLSKGNLTPEKVKDTIKEDDKEKDAEIQQLNQTISQLKSKTQELNTKIVTLKSQLQQKQKQLDKLKSTSEYELYNQISSLKKQIQQLKDLTFDISNCIPLQEHCDHHQFFRPQSLNQVSSHLKRVSNYCKEIDKHEDQRLEQMKQEKAMFVRLIEKIKQQVSKDSRMSVWNLMKSDRQLAPYARIFNDSYIEDSNIRFSEPIEVPQAAQSNKNLQEEVQSNSPSREAETSSPSPKVQQLFSKQNADVFVQ